MDSLPDSSLELLFFQPLFRFDYWLFTKINRDWINPVFDTVLPFLREAEFWLPFYLFLLVFSLVNFGKKGGWWAASLIMTAVISDLVSSSVVKRLIIRDRPCHDPVIADQVRFLVKYC